MGFALQTKFEQPFGNHCLQTLGLEMMFAFLFKILNHVIHIIFVQGPRKLPSWPKLMQNNSLEQLFL